MLWESPGPERGRARPSTDEPLSGVGTDYWGLREHVPGFPPPPSYDTSYLYYVDTCWKSTGCRSSGQPESAANSGQANVWKIRKSWMYKLMHGKGQGGYYRFNGHWPWSDYVHAPW